MSDLGNIAGGAASGAVAGSSFLTPGLGSIIGAGIGAGSSLLGGLFGAEGQSATNAQQFANSEMMFSQEQTANQHFMDQSEAYNTLMASTAYQRSMEDMYKAGLNPILAAGGNVTNIGSSPTASVSPVGSGPLGNPGAMLGAGVASAGQAATTAAALKNMLQDAELKKSNTDVADATVDLTKNAAAAKAQETRTGAANEDAARANAAEANSRTANNALTGALIQAQTNSANTDVLLKQLEADANKRFGVGVWGNLLNTLYRGAQAGQSGATAREIERKQSYNLGNQDTQSSTPLTINIKRNRGY